MSLSPRRSCIGRISLIFALSLFIYFPCQGSSWNRVVWQHTDGRVATWDFVDTSYYNDWVLRDGQKVSSDWQIKGIGDFGGVNLLWQNTEGRIALWQMDGHDIASYIWLNHGRPVASGWRVAGAADMDGDAKSDIIWRHQNGNLAVWLMDGTNYLSSKILNGGKPVSHSWRLAAIRGFNGDASNDLLWQNSNGLVGLWIMDRLNLVKSELLNNGNPVAANWSIVDAADFSGDNQTDILWQNSEGQQAFWLMNPTNYISRSSSVLIRDGQKVESGWRVAGSYGIPPNEPYGSTGSYSSSSSYSSGSSYFISYASSVTRNYYVSGLSETKAFDSSAINRERSARSYLLTNRTDFSRP